ncbi:MAG: folE, partial [Ilumatobacteraceae bacterium]|nr:folE [Ilumatobacteraceae bacterium]
MTSAEPGTHTSRVDHDRLRAAVREMLVAIGEDPDRDGLRDTPDRVARMYAEVTAGMREDPSA